MTAAPEEVTPADPERTSDEHGGTPDQVHIPETEGVEYLIEGEVVTGEVLSLQEETVITARPEEGFVLAPEAPAQWTLSSPGESPAAERGPLAATGSQAAALTLGSVLLLTAGLAVTAYRRHRHSD